MITKLKADQIVAKYSSFYRKEIMLNNKKVFLYSYVLKDYKAMQEEPLSRELRGLVITSEPQEVFLSVPAFFNINEIPETQYSNLKHQKIKKIQEKLDGSLITPILLNGEIFCKSKASFESSQAKQAQQIVDSSTTLKYFILDTYANNFIPFFELTGTENQHVLDQDHPLKLTLIQVRDQEGHFIDIDKFGYPYSAKSYNITWEELLSQQETKKGIEGYVVKTTNGILKIKTKEFFELHSISQESTQMKIILSRILNETLDDMLSLIKNDLQKNKIKDLNDITSEYVGHQVQLIQNIQKEGLSQKELAIKYSKHRFFNAIMQVNKGVSAKDAVIAVLSKIKKESQAKAFFDDLTKN